MSARKNQLSIQWIVYGIAIWLIFSGTVLEETKLSEKKLTLGTLLLLSGKALPTEKLDDSLNQTILDLLQKVGSEDSEDKEDPPKS